MKTDTSKSLFFVKGIIVTFVFCYMILTAAAIGLQYMKDKINDNLPDNMSVGLQESNSAVDANIDNVTNPTFVLATSVFMSVFAAIVIGIPLYNLRCKE